MKKKFATSLFIVSFLAVITQSIYNLFIQNYADVTGVKMIMPLVIIVIALFLVWYSKNETKKGILT
jgi:hypothetical protein